MALLPLTKRLYGVICIERFSSVERLLLSWLEAMSSLVCQHCIFCKIYLCQHFISCTIYHLLQNILAAINFIIGDRLQLANGDLSTVPWVHQSSPFAPGGILHILCLWYPHLCPCSPNQAKKHEKSFYLRSSLFFSLTSPANSRRSRRLDRRDGRRLWWGASTLCHDQRVLWLLSAGP